MSSDAMAIETAGAAGQPWVETLHEWVTTVDHKRLGILYIALCAVVPGHRRNRSDHHADPADTPA